MGVPMIQSKVRRKTSLIWGTLLALLLGVAAAFVVLAMPIRMLETVTTATRLSKLMVQAEPPISPNDRTLLAVLAGIFTAGIGWVLVDWLLFGRAGMSTLIRTRDDDYEDEDEDAFRPTDPLDLVNPMASSNNARSNDWAMPSAGDTRRPLSARTDIGDPPMPMPGAIAQPSAMPGANQALPPLGQILPGAGVSPPPLPSAMPVPAIQQPAAGQAPQAGSLWDVAGPASWPPLDLENPVPAASVPAAPVAMPAPPPVAAAPTPAANMPSWLPAPGNRAEAAPEAPQATDLPPPLSDAFAMPQVPPPLPIPQPQAPEPMISQAEAPPSPRLPEPPVFPPDLLPGQPIAAAPAPEPIAPPPLVQQPAPAAAPSAWDAVAQQPPAAPASAGLGGLDSERLEDLLLKLERTVRSRRAAQAQLVQPLAQAPAPVMAPAPAPIQAPAPVHAAPPSPMPPPIQRYDPPAGFAAPPPYAPTAIPQPQQQAMPVLQPAPQPAPVAQPTPTPGPAPVQSIIPVTAVPAGAPIEDSQRAAMLEQPLHLTLDQLRNMVRR